MIILTGCGLPLSTAAQVVIALDSCLTVSRDYTGNGVQWDPYRLDYGKGRVELSADDLAKIYRRLDFMKPGLVRMMINASSLMSADGKPIFDDYYRRNLEPFLDYCRARGITVVFGDWGGSLVDKKHDRIDTDKVRTVVSFIRYLINEKKTDCLRYFNFVNEPNGYWSATDGDFSLWARGMKEVQKEMERQNISSRVSLVGPDAAIWTTDETSWVSNSASQLGNIIGLYDIHTYPSKYTVNTNQYYDIIKAYRDCVPAGKKIIMGEIGLKYVAPEDKALNELNLLRAKNSPNTSEGDSQMSVFDLSYGLDMADALIQTLNAGYSGTVAWMLDDAMHSNEAPDKLKVWGFWNILGEEYFGADREKLRPWFYAWSMLCRAIPSGSEILSAASDFPAAVKCAFARSNDRYSVLLLNNSDANLSVSFAGTGFPELQDAKMAVYSESSLPDMSAEPESLPGIKSIAAPAEGDTLALPAKSLTVISNIF